MALLNHAKKELSAKIVYYGPGLSGKTTNLEWIHRKWEPDKRGKLISLETKTDRTLFFDFLPVQIGEIAGFRTRFNVYTVPGQIFYNETPNYRCEDSVIKTHEQTGAELDAILPEGAQVYWNLTSNMLLLYLPDIEIYPPMLNTSFNFVVGSQPEDSADIYRFSYWDEHLDATWLADADYLLVAGERLKPMEDVLASGRYQLVETTSTYETCRPEKSIVYIYQPIDKD